MEFLSDVGGGEDRGRPSFFELAAQGEHSRIVDYIYQCARTLKQADDIVAAPLARPTTQNNCATCLIRSCDTYSQCLPNAILDTFYESSTAMTSSLPSSCLRSSGITSKPGVSSDEAKSKWRCSVH